MATITFPKVSLKESLDRPSGAPAFDIGFEAFQAKMLAFQEAIDSYVLREKEAISQSAAQHTANVRNLNAGKEEMEARITEEQTKEREMLETIEAERLHLSDLQASVTRLHTQLSRTREAGAAVEAELAGVRKEAGVERAHKERQVKILADMASTDDQQVALLQSALGLKIMGAGANILLFTFTLLDAAKPDREFSFVLDTSEGTYRLTQCSPPIATAELVAQLNEDNDFSGFVKRIRAAFKAHIGR